MICEPVTRRRFLDRCARCALGGLAAGSGLALGRDASAAVGNVSNVQAQYWHVVRGQETQCDLCPRACRIKPGERGFCGARENANGKYVTRVYGKPCAKGQDPMEKGPFYHYLPKTTTLALGTAGCNLDCLYCQSAEFAQARPEQTDNVNLPPAELAAQVAKYGLRTITFTFSEPLQCVEYVIDTAREAHQRGVKVLFHSAGYARPGPFRDLCHAVDAINIDLKGFSEDFYRANTGGQLAPVLESLQTAAASGKHLEVTNLVVPGYNDDLNMVAQMCCWIRDNLGPETPVHFSRFFPKYKMQQVPPTAITTLEEVRQAAYKAGIRYAYVGNVPGHGGESTYCPKCNAMLVKHVGYQSITYEALNQKTGKCVACGLKIPGVWR